MDRHVAEAIPDAVRELIEYVRDHDLPEPWNITRLTITPDRDNPGGWAVRAFGGPGSESAQHDYAVYVTAEGQTVMDAA